MFQRKINNIRGRITLIVSNKYKLRENYLFKAQFRVVRTGNDSNAPALSNQQIANGAAIVFECRAGSFFIMQPAFPTWTLALLVCKSYPKFYSA